MINFAYPAVKSISSWVQSEPDVSLHSEMLISHPAPTSGQHQIVARGVLFRKVITPYLHRQELRTRRAFQERESLSRLVIYRKVSMLL